jgi:uncharacterized membrane protein YbhN (UPF0104 family)
MAAVRSTIEEPTSEARPGAIDARAPRGKSLFSAFALSYGLAGVLIATLIWAGGVWNLLGNTRLLALLYRSGVVALTDADQGLVQGAPSPDYFLSAQDPVEWILIPIAVLILVAMWNLRGFMFSGFARAAGLPGSIGEHTNAYLYGAGVNVLLPYRLGTVATASVLEPRGVAPERSAQITFLDEVFTVLNIFIFTIVGLLALGGTTAIGELLWGAVILLITFLVVRKSGLRGESDRSGGWLEWARQSLSALSHHPGTFIRLLTVSILAFALELVAVYVISQAFSGSFVLLNVDFRVLMMGVIAGHLAALIPLTPGGIGQFEWGFAAALYIGEVGIPEAVTIAFLYYFFRNIVALILMGIARRRGGSPTNLRGVLALIRTRQTEVAA